LPDLPSAKEYIDDVLPRLQNSSASIKERYELANAILFQVMRLLFLKEAHLVSRVFLAKKELLKVAREKAAAAAKAAEADGELPDDIKAINSNTITESSVEIEIKVLQQARKIISDDEEAKRASEAKSTANGTDQQAHNPPTDETKGTETDDHNISTEEPVDSQDQTSQPNNAEIKEDETKPEITKLDPMDTDIPTQEGNEASEDAPNESDMQEDNAPDTTNDAANEDDKESGEASDGADVDDDLQGDSQKEDPSNDEGVNEDEAL
jgi:hypothetical protein